MAIINFQYIYLLGSLLLLPLIAAFYFAAKKRKARAEKALGDPELVAILLRDYRRISFAQKFLCMLFAMALLGIALANPRTASGKNNITRSGIEVMLVLDVSKSMLAQDVQPNRLERAKLLMNRLVDKLGTDKVGMIVFAGRAYLQMPLSNDLAAAKMYIGAATPESIPTQGTVIADALNMAYASFNAKEKKYKSIVLVSDGEDHDENAIKAASDIAAEGVIINTVAIGSQQGAPILDAATGGLIKDENGNTVISKVNEDELKQIAQKGGGVYQYFSDAETNASAISSVLKTMDQRPVNDDSLTNYTTFFQYFAGLALVLLLIEMFISEKNKRRSVLAPRIAISLFFFFLSSSSLFAQNEKQLIKEGNKAYAEKKYDVAASNYQKALAVNPQSAEANYNLGNAVYKSGNKDSAEVIFDRSLPLMKTPANQVKAYYNKGVALQNNNKIPECIEAYKQALRIDPKDDDARQNLQKALKQQKQQQQQQDKKQDQDKDKDEQNEKPKPKPSKLTQKEAEEKLKALMQQEKNLQDKLHKNNSQSPQTPEKDW